MKIAIIPARGGSKRIKKKNIRDFCGFPIIYYSITQAKLSGIFDRIIVSTDDDEIATIAMKYGAEVPFKRPKELADDFIGTNDVVKHVINWLKDEDKIPDYVCCIYPTAPFLKAKYLEDGFRLLVEGNKTFVIAVTSFSYPIQRSMIIDDRGYLKYMWPDCYNKRSQDLDDTYHDAGQFYWGDSMAFLNNSVERKYPIILPINQVQDIDTLEDWKQAELMFKSMQQMEYPNEK